MKVLLILFFLLNVNFAFCSGVRGDINNDDNVDISDVILCLRQAIGLDRKDFKTADLNFDKQIDISDVILTLRIAIDLEVTFEIFPVPLETVGKIEGLGHFNPGSGHIIPVNHMYVLFPEDIVGTETSVDVSVPKGGNIIMFLEYEPCGENEVWQVYIKVNDDFVYALMYMTGLSDRITNIINSPPYNTGWIYPEEPGGYPRVLFLGITGQPDSIPVDTGEKLGTFKLYGGEDPLTTWDWWVMDKKINRYFVNPQPDRYPSFNDFMGVLGLAQEIPYNMDINAGRFPDYYKNKQIHNFLVSKLESTEEGNFGSNSWDIYGKLQGTWFNPEIDNLPLEDTIFRRDTAAISITPERGNETNYAIAIGNMDGTDPDLALLDDDPREREKQHNPEIEDPFEGEMNGNNDINPDPSLIAPGRKVAYELNSGSHIHTLLVYMENETTCEFKIIWHFEDGQSHAIEDFNSNNPDETWITYIR